MIKEGVVEEKQLTRKSGKHLRVPVLPDEERIIKDKAKEAGKGSIATYLRELGLGCEMTSVIDSQLVADLAKINADQGRLGGLLKMWLTNDERFSGFNGVKMRATIEAVLAKIEEAQNELLAIAKKAGGETK